MAVNLIQPTNIPGLTVYGVEQKCYTVDGEPGLDYAAALATATLRESVAIEDAATGYSELVRQRERKITEPSPHSRGRRALSRRAARPRIRFPPPSRPAPAIRTRGRPASTTTFSPPSPRLAAPFTRHRTTCSMPLTRRTTTSSRTWFRCRGSSPNATRRIPPPREWSASRSTHLTKPLAT